MRIKLLLTILLVVSGLSIQISQAQFTKLFDFGATAIEGMSPCAGFISDGTFLYGTTRGGGIGGGGGGTIFKIKPDGSGYQKMHDFTGLNGSEPRGTLLFDGTFLYGTTFTGGESIYGTIFKIKPDGTGFVQLFDFDDSGGAKGANATIVSDGTFLYGTVWTGGPGVGNIYKIKPDGTGYADVYGFTDGTHPMALYTDSTYIYGMTIYGGASGDGIIYRIKPDATNYTKFCDFNGSLSGSTPHHGFCSDGTFLYGMTQIGGVNNMGVIFRIMLDGSNYLKLLDFDGTAKGSKPVGSLTLAGGVLYGMAEEGGTNNLGTIFKIQTDGTGFTKLLDFDGPLYGSRPTGTLFSDGTFLYGMAFGGGDNNTGTIFKSNFTTGISENNTSTEINIYPNPSNGIFTVQQNSNQESRLEICNVLGELIYTSIISGNSSEIDLSLKAKGIYFVRLIRDRKVIATKKLLISN